MRPFICLDDCDLPEEAVLMETMSMGSLIESINPEIRSERRAGQVELYEGCLSFLGT